MVFNETIISSAVVLFLVMDPLGNIPIFLSLLKDIDQKEDGK
jgi:multiple antibiotic resistance protein